MIKIKAAITKLCSFSCVSDNTVTSTSSFSAHPITPPVTPSTGTSVPSNYITDDIASITDVVSIPVSDRRCCCYF